MRTAEDIIKILDELEFCIADDLEKQDLDFKQWETHSKENAIKIVVQMAVCMANGGGGTVVFGVSDRIKGRDKAITGVPQELDVNLLKKAVYDQTDPKITPVFENISVPEGTGRLILMQIYPGMPPYTDTAGRGSIRIGKDCKPLTGTMRTKITVETGESDFTAEVLSTYKPHFISASAMETLRNQALKERAPQELLQLSDLDLLNSLNLIKNKKITRAGLLLAGTEQAIREYVPGHNWTFLQMLSDYEYGIREDRISALILSVLRIEELLLPFNTISTHKEGLFHYEYRTWPEIAIREALMNAFCHADFRIPGPIMVKLYPDRLEIANNGFFIAGITPENILHHQPVARNPLLVEALTRLRLVNRSNLGISRMFSSLLVEGKEIPVIREIGETVMLSFPKRELNAAFRVFVAEESQKGRDLNIDELLLLQYLLQHPEIDTLTAAALCQRSDREVRERLVNMEAKAYIEHGGTKSGTYWCITSALYKRLAKNGHAETRRRIDWEAAKTRILSILMERARRDETGLSNKEIRQITLFNRNQVSRMMLELRQEHKSVLSIGYGAGAKYIWQKNN